MESDMDIEKTIRGTEVLILFQDWDNGVPTFIHAIDEFGRDFPLTDDEIKTLREEATS